MVSIRLMLVAAMLVALTGAEDTEEMYTTNFDNIDVENILGNERLVDNFVKCFMDQGKCSPEGKELKIRISDALETACKKCSAKQMELADKGINFLYNKRRADFDRIAGKYDPTGVYFQRYKKYLREESATTAKPYA